LATSPNSFGWSILALIAVLVGTGWRTAHTNDRPLHADEAVQAWQTWTLLKGEGYTYDPVDRHGPLLYYGSAAQHRLGGGTAETYDDRSARSFVLAAGIATLILVGFGARTAGFDPRIGAIATALLAVEVFTTLYHTYFVQEAWLALFVWAFFFLSLRHDSKRPLARLFAMGMMAGLAQATKETAPLYLGIALGASWVAQKRLPHFRNYRGILIAVVGFLLPVTAFYTAFGTQPEGLLDAVRTYTLQANRMAESPHTYPWWQYLRTLGLIATSGPHWGQFVLLALAMGGTLSALRPTASPAHRATALFVVTVFIVHSAIPYKTPWLILTAVLGLPILAAHAIILIAGQSRVRIILAALIAIVAVAESGWRGWLVLDRYPGDARNPYFYEQTPRSFTRLTTRLEQLQSVSERPLHVAVVSAEAAWPLPWYLRNSTATGYFESRPPHLSEWDVIVWDRQLGEPPLEMATDRLVEYHGLRPNVLLEVFITNSIWRKRFPPDPAPLEP
jgi:uncharacterized protein (TIGR03663 family)